VGILKVIANCCLVFLAVIAVGVSTVYGYYHFFVNEKTVGVNYIDDQTGVDIIEQIEAGTLTPEQIEDFESRKFIEVNYYSNAKNNGLALQELRFNYFTDYTLQSTAYRSSGMQYIGDLQLSDVSGKCIDGETELLNGGYFRRYDTTNGISWEGNNVSDNIDRDSTYVIKIDKTRAFELQLTGKEHWTTSSTDGWKVFRTVGCMGVNLLWEGTDFQNKIEHTHYYNFIDVFADCMQAVRTNSAQYGDYYIVLDLSKYFSVKEFDTKTGKYKADDVTDVIKNYSVMKFHYDENGARNSTQSLFNCIDYNPSYDIEDKKVDTAYWQERMVYTLTDKNFDLRYSDVYNGYFVSLNVDTKVLFEKMPRVKANVKIDSLFGDKNIVGIDYNGFENFEIDTLSIDGKGTFYLLNKSLNNTKVQTIKHSSS